MRSVTSQGSPQARFWRAVAGGNPLLVETAARELPRLGLVEALAVCLAFSKDQSRFQRAALRWHGRYLLEYRPAPEEARLVLDALLALTTEVAGAGVAALLEVLERRELDQAVSVLEQWAERRLT